AYAQRNPLNEYKQEAFTLFETMLATLRINVTRILAHVELRTPEMEANRLAANRQAEQSQGQFQENQGDTTAAETVPKVGRNAPCPCGSGKKYKHCHGRLAA
ncbi:MAG: SEC-C metal-binding domain-containing protein, partial [Bacteroidota bacterium]